MTAEREALEPAKSAAAPLPGQQVELDEAERARLYTELSEYWAECAWPPDEVTRRKRDWDEYNCAKAPEPKHFPITTYDGEPHSADIRLPVLRAFADAWCAQVSETVFAERPFLAVEPAHADPNPQRCEDAESYLDYFYETVARYPRIANEWHLRCAIEGTGILHVPYVTERKRHLQRLNDPITGEILRPSVLETVYDGPKPEVVPLDRFRLYPSDSPSIADAYAVFHETSITRRELKDLRDEGKAVITDDQWRAMGEGDDRPNIPETDGKGGKGEYSHTFRVVYAWMPYKVGKEDSVTHVFAFLPDHAGVVYSVTPSNTGDVIPFVAAKARLTGQAFVGQPLPRILDHVLSVINTNMDQAVDHATLRALLLSSPVVSPAAKFDPYEPWLGAPVVMQDPNGFKFLDIGPNAENLQLVTLFLELAKEFTGINSTQLNAPMPSGKTATEIITINTQGSKLYRQQIELLNICHVEAAEIIAWQMYLNGPETIEYPVPLTLAERAEAPMMAPMGVEGMDGMPPMPEPPKWKIKTARAEDFAPGLRFAVRGSGAHLNRAEEVNEALMLRQTFLEDPLAMADAGRLWELDRNILTAMRVPDPEVFIGPRPEDVVSVPMLVAQSMPPPPEEPEPMEEGPKISVSVAFSDLPADAQGALLEGLGLPGMGAYQGESAAPTPDERMQTEAMRLEAKQRAVPNGSAVGDGPGEGYEYA